MKKIIVGIDYSLSCPCLTILKTSKEFFDGKSYYLLDNKKSTGKFQNIEGNFHSLYKCPEQRYENIANWVIDKITPYEDVHVYIEDYSMGSKGKVFHIAENAGILKYSLYKRNISFTLIPPTVLKKFATGKGNAKKEQMYESFEKLYPKIDLKNMIQPDRMLGNPVTDIVDSYFLARLGWEKINA